MTTGKALNKSAKWLLATLLVAGAALCAVGETGRWNMFERRLGMFVHWGIYPVGPLVRGLAER